MRDAVEVFEQIQRATRTLRRLPPVGVQNRFCNWPEIIRSFYECYGWNDPDPPKIYPTSRQLTELDQVIRWLAWLSQHPAWGDRYTRVIWARACRLPWRPIARQMGKSPRTCQEWFRLGVHAILYAEDKGSIK